MKAKGNPTMTKRNHADYQHGKVHKWTKRQMTGYVMPNIKPPSQADLAYAALLTSLYVETKAISNSVEQPEDMTGDQPKGD